MLNTFRARSSCEQDAKFIQDRILHVEKTTAELCYVFGQYTRKAAHLRDKGDEMSRIFLEYSDGEEINRSTSDNLEDFSRCVSRLSDHENSRVRNLECKVVQEFSRYDEKCKKAKEELKHLYGAREKEIAKKRQLDRVKERNPKNRQQIIHAETEVVRATAEVAKCLHGLEERTTEFEKQKLHDMKSILLDFVTVEMGYHAKALEVLTKAYRTIDNIDVDADLKEFKRSLRTPKPSYHFGMKKNTGLLYKGAKSMDSLRALFGGGGGTSSLQREGNQPEGIPKNVECLWNGETTSTPSKPTCVERSSSSSSSSETELDESDQSDDVTENVSPCCRSDDDDESSDGQYRPVSVVEKKKRHHRT